MIWVHIAGGGYAESDTRPTPEWIAIDEIDEAQRADAQAAAELLLYGEG